MGTLQLREGVRADELDVEIERFLNDDRLGESMVWKTLSNLKPITYLHNEWRQGDQKVLQIKCPEPRVSPGQRIMRMASFKLLAWDFGKTVNLVGCLIILVMSGVPYVRFYGFYGQHLN